MPGNLRSIRFYAISSLLFMAVMMLFFTVFYYFVEPNLTLMDAFYFTVITTRTIGFGDIYPTTFAGKIGTIMNALVPATIFLGVSLVLLEAFFRNLETTWRRWRMSKLIDHTIVTAELDMLPSIIAECRMDNRPILIVDKKPYDQLSEQLAQLISDGEYLSGDPTDDHVLKRAGIAAARSIIIATASDTTNLFVLVSARSLNPGLKTVVRVDHEEAEAKFRAVGADYLLPTGSILGRLLSQAAVNPISHRFLVKLHTHTQDPFLSEVVVPRIHVGKAVSSVYPCAVAIYRGNDYLFELKAEALQEGDVVLTITLKFPREQLTTRPETAP